MASLHRRRGIIPPRICADTFIFFCSEAVWRLGRCVRAKARWYKTWASCLHALLAAHLPSSCHGRSWTVRGFIAGAADNRSAPGQGLKSIPWTRNVGSKVEQDLELRAVAGLTFCEVERERTARNT